MARSHQPSPLWLCTGAWKEQPSPQRERWLWVPESRGAQRGVCGAGPGFAGCRLCQTQSHRTRGPLGPEGTVKGRLYAAGGHCRCGAACVLPFSGGVRGELGAGRQHLSNREKKQQSSQAAPAAPVGPGWGRLGRAVERRGMRCGAGDAAGSAGGEMQQVAPRQGLRGLLPSPGVPGSVRRRCGGRGAQPAGAAGWGDAGSPRAAVEVRRCQRNRISRGRLLDKIRAICLI